MLFNSFPFIFGFLPAAVVGFYVAASLGRTPARAWLGLASLAFYTWWYPPFAIVLVCSVCFNYAAGTAILALRDRSWQRRVLAASVACDLMALGYYKYAFWLTTLVWHAGLTARPWMGPVLLPLGISFFTFTQIGFLIDCQGGAVRDKSFVNYWLFATFFPHLIAGPILHHREIMPQFERDDTYRLDWDNLAQGLALFVIGLCKKVLLADGIAAYARPGFADPAALSAFPAWGAALAYSLQLYFDFSGYSDMAIGIAKMCNVQFPMNFNSPYRAVNIIDFWQRWHMTLTRYLTLYLYNPLALWVTRRRVARGQPVSRQAVARLPVFAMMVAVPMFYTMALAGIWHGAGVQFLIFGLLHGAYLTMNHAWRVFRRKPRGRAAAPPLPRAIFAGWLLTYLAVLVGQVFFRAASPGDAATMLGAMIGLHGATLALPVPYWLPHALGGAGRFLAAHGWIATQADYQHGGDAIREIAWIVGAFTLVLLAPNSQSIVGMVPADRRGPARPALLAPERMSGAWGVVVGLVAVAAVLGIGAKSEFLYFQF